MPETRIIDLRERQPEFALWARIQLDVFSWLPEDGESRQQAFWLYENEYERSKLVEPDEYAPTWLSQLVLEGVNRRLPRRTLVGYIAMAMVALDNAEERMSLELASKVVSEYANTVNTGSFVTRKGHDWVQSEKLYTGDRSTIKKNFQEYRSVAHICAAQIVAADYLERLEPFDSADLATEHYLATVLYFQHRLRKVANFKKWNLWEVRATPANIDGIEPLLPTQERLRELMHPWVKKQAL